MCFYCDREVKGNPQIWWYKNFVCWNCRIQNGLKHSSNLTEENDTCNKICYRCNQIMTDVGFKFKTPSKNNIKQWKFLEKTWQYQYKYNNSEKIYIGPKNKINVGNF